MFDLILHIKISILWSCSIALCKLYCTARWFQTFVSNICFIAQTRPQQWHYFPLSCLTVWKSSFSLLNSHLLTFIDDHLIRSETQVVEQNFPPLTDIATSVTECINLVDSNLISILDILLIRSIQLPILSSILPILSLYSIHPVNHRFNICVYSRLCKSDSCGEIRHWMLSLQFTLRTVQHRIILNSWSGIKVLTQCALCDYEGLHKLWYPSIRDTSTWSKLFST